MTAPRLLPDVPLPPYAYVPGRFPHPVRDPAGHSFGETARAAAPVDPSRWQDCREYLHGVDLFNHGYYWEAHEAWEQLWHASGRGTTTGDFLQGLIKLAAAGVKVREGRAAGTAGLARGAWELLEGVRARVQAPAYLGLRFADLEAHTRLAEGLATDAPDEDLAVRVVFPFVLEPRWETVP